MGLWTPDGVWVDKKCQIKIFSSQNTALTKIIKIIRMYNWNKQFPNKSKLKN